jgi:hypothetical protein
MLFDSILLYLTIPLTSLFIRETLNKWGILEMWSNSVSTILNNLGYCQLCFYTWANFLCILSYAFAVDNYYFLLYTPAFTVIALFIHFKYLEDGQ